MGYVASLPDEPTLEERQAVLRNRLHDGWARVHKAEEAGANTSEWEAFWLQLLAEYESVCRELDGISQTDASPIAPLAQMTLGGQ